MAKNSNKNERMNELANIFKDIPEDKRILCSKMIQNCVFMEETLADLQGKIAETGTVETYQNGENQSGMKPSSALQSYNKTVQSYNALMKNLIALLPESSNAAVDDMSGFLGTK